MNTYVNTLSNLSKVLIPEIRLSNGDLSLYGLNCGYVQFKEIDNNNYINLYHENSTYHIKGRIKSVLFWESFDALIEAREFYKKQLKAITI